MINESMFCPKCGKSDQLPETFCRQCGQFLPDFNKGLKKGQTPEDHLTANAVLNFMTAVVSLTLAILLYSFFLGREDTPVIIYITAGFLTAICAWQVQTFYRTLQLKKHFKRRKYDDAIQTEAQKTVPSIDAAKTKELLPEADFSDAVPASVTEQTTRKLKSKR